MLKEDELKKIIEKSERYCVKAERSAWDVRRKLWDWGLRDKEQGEELIAQLEKERYLDEERFARAYARDKYRFNSWGLRRIEQELRMRQIDSRLIAEVLQEVEEEFDIQEQLKSLLEKKYRSLPAKLERRKVYDRLMRYASYRGFDFDDARNIIEDLMS